MMEEIARLFNLTATSDMATQAIAADYIEDSTGNSVLAAAVRQGIYVLETDNLEGFPVSISGNEGIGYEEGIGFGNATDYLSTNGDGHAIDWRGWTGEGLSKNILTNGDGDGEGFGGIHGGGYGGGLGCGISGDSFTGYE